MYRQVSIVFFHSNQEQVIKAHFIFYWSISPSLEDSNKKMSFRCRKNEKLAFLIMIDLTHWSHHFISYENTKKNQFGISRGPSTRPHDGMCSVDWFENVRRVLAFFVCSKQYLKESKIKTPYKGANDHDNNDNITCKHNRIMIRIQERRILILFLEVYGLVQNLDKIRISRMTHRSAYLMCLRIRQ